MAAVAFVSSHQSVRCQPRSSNLIKSTWYRVLMATLLRVPVENVPSVARQLSRDPTHRFFTRPRDLSSFHGGSTVGRLRSVWPFVAVDRNSLDTPAAVADAPSATLPRCVIFRRLALHPALEIEQTMASSSEILLRRKSSFEDSLTLVCDRFPAIYGCLEISCTMYISFTYAIPIVNLSNTLN